MAEPTPTAISQSTPEELSHFSFSLFVKLPAELQLDILSHCQKNDLICLSLSSYYFRDLTQPLIPSRPRLSSFDQKLPVGPTDCACGDELSIVRVSQDTRAHRQRRHVYAYYQKARSGGDISHPWGWNHPLLRERCEKHSGSPAYPADHPLCHKRGCAHCSCTTCPLHVRLRSWMGDRKYCSQCRKFTVRMSTKKYKGRCECLYCRASSYDLMLVTNASALVRLTRSYTGPPFGK